MPIVGTVASGLCTGFCLATWNHIEHQVPVKPFLPMYNPWGREERPGLTSPVFTLQCKTRGRQFRLVLDAAWLQADMRLKVFVTQQGGGCPHSQEVRHVTVTSWKYTS